MATESLLVSEVIPATPDRIYAAWMSSEEHSQFTGDTALVEPRVGGNLSTFAGYATGRTVDLEPGRRIVLMWRTAEFPEGTADSRVEITLEETLGGTLVTLLHTDIPSGQSERYKHTWLESYLEPLKTYFGTRTRANGHGGAHATVAAPGADGQSQPAPKPIKKVIKKAAKAQKKAAKAQKKVLKKALETALEKARKLVGTKKPKATARVPSKKAALRKAKASKAKASKAKAPKAKAPKARAKTARAKPSKRR